MPKRFNNNEKNRIHNKLLDAGYELFSQYGFKKTSVSDIAKASGIASGTFYSFYASKEELFFALMEQEEQRIQHRLLQQLHGAPMNKEAFIVFLKQSLQLIIDNPILKEVLLPEQLESIIRKVPASQWEGNYAGDVEKLGPLIVEWQSRNVVRADLEPALIVNLIRSLVLLSLQKKAIGNFSDTFEHLATSVAQYLTTTDH